MNDAIGESDAHDPGKTSSDDILKYQYNKLSEDWRHFNTILWGIPTIAVSIMTGIVIAAYQPALMGWPRFILLVVGSMLLLALTVEVIKKRVHMYAISDVIKELQGQNGLDLKDDFQFPVGLSKDVERYWEDKLKRHYAEGKKDVKEPKEDWLFNSLKSYYARRWLAYVTFFASLAVAFLAALVLVYELILPLI